MEIAIILHMLMCQGNPYRDLGLLRNSRPTTPTATIIYSVAKDLSFGWLGHPWQKKLILFGERMLHLLDGYETQLGIEAEV